MSPPVAGWFVGKDYYLDNMFLQVNPELCRITGNKEKGLLALPGGRILPDE